LFIGFLACSTNNENLNQLTYLNDTQDNRQRGAHVFGNLDSLNVEIFKASNIEWITLVPYASQSHYRSAELNHFSGDSLALEKRNLAWKNQITVAKKAGFKVFVKPHIWLHNSPNGTWRSDIYPEDDLKWNLWKSSYLEFILRYANLAEEANADMYCIGTEFTSLSAKKTKYWKHLIEEVRKVYSGKITYAANWYKEYEQIPFWEDLDYIGIQAYFPLVKNNSPSVQEISKGWDNYLPVIKSVHKKYNKKILFTEMGYKSTANSAIEPWLWMEHSSKEDNIFSSETQANCYQAFFDKLWHKKWLAGVHIWQLRSDYIPKKNNMNFTPQGKPAEKIIAKGFE